MHKYDADGSGELDYVEMLACIAPEEDTPTVEGDPAGYGRRWHGAPPPRASRQGLPDHLSNAWCLLIHEEASLSWQILPPRHRMLCTSRDEGSKYVSGVDDVADGTCLSLRCGGGPRGRSGGTTRRGGRGWRGRGGRGGWGQGGWGRTRRRRRARQGFSLVPFTAQLKILTRRRITRDISGTNQRRTRTSSSEAYVTRPTLRSSFGPVTPA